MRDGAEGGKRIYSIVMFKSCDIKLDAWRSCLRAALNTLQSFSFRKSCFHSCSHELANIGRSKILFFLISFRVNRSTSVVTCIESKPSEQILSSTSFMLYVTKKRNTNHTATSVMQIKWCITVCEDRSRVSGHQRPDSRSLLRPEASVTSCLRQWLRRNGIHEAECRRNFRNFSAEPTPARELP